MVSMYHVTEFMFRWSKILWEGYAHHDVKLELSNDVHMLCGNMYSRAEAVLHQWVKEMNTIRWRFIGLSMPIRERYAVSQLMHGMGRPNGGFCLTIATLLDLKGGAFTKGVPSFMRVAKRPRSKKSTFVIQVS